MNEYNTHNNEKNIGKPTKNCQEEGTGNYERSWYRSSMEQERRATFENHIMMSFIMMHIFGILRGIVDVQKIQLIQIQRNLFCHKNIQFL